MADFVKVHKKNTRFSVNRDQRLFLKVSKTEKANWLELVSVLQKRRNTGTQIDTFIYLVKKYCMHRQVVEGLVRNGRFSVGRDSGVLFKLSAEELDLWNNKVSEHGGSRVEAFMDMVNAEYHFQDKIETITF